MALHAILIRGVIAVLAGQRPDLDDGALARTKKTGVHSGCFECRGVRIDRRPPNLLIVTAENSEAQRLADATAKRRHQDGFVAVRQSVVDEVGGGAS